MHTKHLLTPLLLLLGLAACQQNADTTASPAVADKKPATSAARSPGKPSAPVSIEYKVLGTPLVGQPVAIEIKVASNDPGQLMRLSYFINDTDSMLFADSQPESIDIEIPRDEAVAARQVRLVPQREGRLYLNVTAEVTTSDGMMLKSISVPISVGSNAVDLDINGELKEAADNETVISMPAVEN
ncbi:MAG: hypothetical protein WBM54_07885 [Woeseia sp.]